MRFVFLLILPIVYSWNCILLQTKQIHEGIYWKTQNCTKEDNEIPLSNKVCCK